VDGRRCELTFFRKGSISLAVQPGVFQESKSERWARVYTSQLIACQGSVVSFIRNTSFCPLVLALPPATALHASCRSLTQHPLPGLPRGMTYRTSTQCAATRHDRRPASQRLGLVSVPEHCDLAGGEKVPRVQCWVHHFGHVVIVGSLLDQQDLQIAVCFGEAGSDHAAGESAYGEERRVSGCLESWEGIRDGWVGVCKHIERQTVNK
jgi:hypothetical protein